MKDYIKAIRKADRELEFIQGGWKATHKIHKSKKTYKRDNKNKIMNELFSNKV